MSPLFRKSVVSGRSQTVVLIDIGSGSVGVALVELAPGREPSVLAFKRVSLKLTPGRSALTLGTQLRKSLKEALADLSRHSRRRTIKHAAVFVPAPWGTLLLHKVRFAEESPFLANAALLNKLVQQHVQHEQQIQREQEQPGTEVFERTIAGIRLNGYASPSLPEHTEVFKIELMLAAAHAPAEFLHSLSQAVGEAFAGAAISFHSSVLAAAHAIAATRDSTDSFLLCDGEGELAELLLVRETIPEAHATIPVGYATMLRTLAVHAGMSHEELPSALVLLSDTRSPLWHSAEEAIQLAQKECADALGAAEPLCHIAAPAHCYIIGDGPEAHWFAEAVKKSPRLRSVLPKNFEAQVLSARSLGGSVTMPPGKKGDAMLALEALFAADRFGSGASQHFYQ